MDSLLEKRFELVSSPNTERIADIIRLLISYCGLECDVSDTVLTGEQLHAFAGSLKTGPYLPVLYDNVTRIEINQSCTILDYLGKQSASKSGVLSAIAGTTSVSNGVRASLTAEMVVRFIRDNTTAENSAVAIPKEKWTSRLQQQVQMLQAVLDQSSIAEEDIHMGITYGDLSAWYFLFLVQEKLGPLALASFPGLNRFFHALAKNSAISSFVEARKARQRSAGTVVQAVASAVESVEKVLPPAASTATAVASKVVAVTGASGFIASWIVKFLLEMGYVVHGTVRSLKDTAKYEHLLGFPGASNRLKLYEADLLKDGSFIPAFAGCEVVFHCASPFFFETPNPTEDLIKPAVEGTRNVLRAVIATPSIRKVVLTSSVAAVYITKLPSDHFYTESDWSDLDHIRHTKQHYAESKLLAEQEAWRIMREEVPKGRKLRLCAMCPPQTIGPLLQPTLNTSCSSVLNLLNGSTKTIPNKAKCFVDVRDVALAHIAAAENDRAEGRYLLIASSVPWRVVADQLRKVLPTAKITHDVEAGPPTTPQALASILRIHELGVHYTPIETSIRDCALSLYARGFLDDVIAPSVDSRQPPYPAARA